MANKTNTDLIRELSRNVSQCEERLRAHGDEVARIREIELNLTQLATEVKEFRERVIRFEKDAERLNTLLNEESERVRVAATRLVALETHIAELKKSADQNRITTPTVIGWIITAIGVLAAITIGLLNYSKK